MPFICSISSISLDYVLVVVVFFFTDRYNRREDVAAAGSQKGLEQLCRRPGRRRRKALQPRWPSRPVYTEWVDTERHTRQVYTFHCRIFKFYLLSQQYRHCKNENSRLADDVRHFFRPLQLWHHSICEDEMSFGLDGTSWKHQIRALWMYLFVLFNKKYSDELNFIHYEMPC